MYESRNQNRERESKGKSWQREKIKVSERDFRLFTDNEDDDGIRVVK